MGKGREKREGKAQCNCLSVHGIILSLIEDRSRMSVLYNDRMSS
jgi:hypothetical protein